MDDQRDREVQRNQRRAEDAIDIFLRLGYDIRENDDVQRLAEILRWASDERRRFIARSPHRMAIFVSTSIAVVSVALTVLGQWVLSKFGGIH